MRAAQYVSPGRVALVETPAPVCGPHQVLVRVEYVGVCGSDLTILYHTPAEAFPFPPGASGHECVGVVAHSALPGFAAGDRVLVLPPETNALAEYVAVEPQYLIPLPANLDSRVAVLAQQFGTVIYCLRRLDSLLDKDVVIVGQGAAGLFFTALCAHSGARQVITLDVVEARLAMSRRMGATQTINLGLTDPLSVVRELTGGLMADVVIEAVGKAETIHACPDLARVGGELALFGISREPVFPFNYANFFRKYLRTTTTADAQSEPGLRSFRLALALLAQNRIDVAPLITHCLPLEQSDRAFHLAEMKLDGVVKVLIAVQET
ncbi:MAG: zinc-binding dehydrogenase [Ardenticatenaceae bacterium]|nr:zinc-binding dehydrogenase [Ardenticatenaceae bacterium]